MNLEDRFARFDAEYLKFDRVLDKKSARPDLHAMILLDKLFPTESARAMVSAAQHDEFWLDVTEDQIETLKIDQVIELVRCGVSFDECSLRIAA